MRKKRLGSPSSAVRKDRLGKRGTSWGRLSQLREAGWGNGGGRGKSWQRLLAKKREPSLRLGPRPAPRRKPARSDHPGETRSSGFPWPPQIPDTPSPICGCRRPPLPGDQAARIPIPTEGSTAPNTALRLPPAFRGQPQAWVPRDPQHPPAAPLSGSHLRGASIAELVGDGLDAPCPGHRDIAALRAHVQPHHRHGRLSVRLLLGSV